MINTLFRETSPTVFVGDQNSSVKRWVGGRYSIPTVYCTGGISTGQICRWKVTDLAWKVDSKNGDGSHAGTIRWLQIGKKAGRCVIGGDSGGPVYTFRPDGYVVAKGITSISNTKTERIMDTCVHGFTDFHDEGRRKGHLQKVIASCARRWVLVLVMLATACAQEPGEPFDEPVRVVEGSPDRSSLTLHASGLGWGDSTCTAVKRGEAVESAASVTVRVTLRPTCPETGELGIGTGIDHAVPVTLKAPLGRRKILDSAGREVLVCRPTGKSWMETYRQCLERG